MARSRAALLEDAGDRAETVLRAIDRKTGRKAGVSVFHILTAASILGSVWLFLKGRKAEGIFVGLWPATFEALRSATRRR